MSRATRPLAWSVVAALISLLAFTGCANSTNPTNPVLAELAAEVRAARHAAWDARRQANRAQVWAEAAEHRAAEAQASAGRAETPEPIRAPEDPHRKADRLRVRKSERKLELFREGELFRTFPIALGFEPEGHKQWRGDGRTPEGIYRVDSRRETTRYGRALHIAYPRPEDVERARVLGVDPGGAIYIHGLPVGLGMIGAEHAKFDWTNGCIALTDEEIAELWLRVDDGTEIEIVP